MIRVLFALAVWWYAFGVVADYSGIWQSQAFPATADVTTKGGEVLSGALHRDWAGNWVLKQEGSDVLRFDDQAVTSIAFHKRQEPLGYSEMWRDWGPIVLLSWVTFLFAVWPMRRRLRRIRGGSIGVH